MIDETKSDRKVLLGLFLLAVVIRVAAVFWLGPNRDTQGDEHQHYDTARHVAEGRGYSMVPQQAADLPPRPTAFRMPGPILVMAVPIALFGPKYDSVRLLCAVVASLSAPLIFVLTRRKSTRRAALTAGLICVFYPAWVYYSGNILSEPFFVPCLLGALLLTDEIREGGKWSGAVAGLAWGATIYMRPHGLPICLLAAMYVGWKWDKRAAVLMLAAVGLTLLPWVIRNFIVFNGRIVVMATESGETFLGANNDLVYETPRFQGMWNSPLDIPEYAARLAPIRDEIDRSKEQMKMGIEYLRAHPDRIPTLVYRKCVRWLTPVTATGGMIRYLALLSYGPLLLLLFLGSVRGIYKDTGFYLPLICLAANLAITAVYWGNLVRGRIPLEIVFIPWAAISLERLLFGKTVPPAPVGSAPE